MLGSFDDPIIIDDDDDDASPDSMVNNPNSTVKKEEDITGKQSQKQKNPDLVALYRTDESGIPPPINPAHHSSTI